tara:strand:+ start:4706 stop:4858 length:153 start_codon:yes stop_codon:yes gene_type:complete
MTPKIYYGGAGRGLAATGKVGLGLARQGAARFFHRFNAAMLGEVRLGLAR